MEPQYILIAIFLLGLAYIAFRDLTAFWIPDHATLSLGLLGIIWVILMRADVWGFHVGAAAIGGLGFALIAWLYRKVRGHDGLGLGDAKLVAVGGLWLGPSLAWAVAVGCGLALVTTLCLMGLKMRAPDAPIPLGFYLSIGFAVSVFA